LLTPPRSPPFPYTTLFRSAAALAGELGWSAGDRAAALACDVVCCVTPGADIVVTDGDLRAGQHLNMLGADGSGKAEASLAAVRRSEEHTSELQSRGHLVCR